MVSHSLWMTSVITVTHQHTSLQHCQPFTIDFAMTVLAFKVYLRVGVMVPQTKGISQNYLQCNDVTIHDTSITVSFRH